MNFSAGNSNSGGWAWDSGFPRPAEEEGQLKTNTQVIQMNWGDILGAKGSPLTSGTSPFKLPSSMLNGNTQAQTPGVYTGTGIRHEVEGQPPATFRISVGNSGGDYGGVSSLPQSYGNTTQYGQGGGNRAHGTDGGDTNGPKPLPEMMSWIKMPQYHPCGNCNACKFQQNPKSGIP